MSSTEVEIIDANGQVRQGVSVGAPNATFGQVLTADGAGGSAWDDAGGGGLSVSDGETTVDDVTSIVFSGATVTDGGGGEADVDVSGGSPPISGLSVNLGFPAQKDIDCRVAFNASPSDAPSGSTDARTGPPLAVAPSSPVCNSNGVSIGDVPNIEDTLDVSMTIYVTDLAGANTLTVSKSDETATPIPSNGYSLDWTDSDATIIGVDLSWDPSTGTVTSAAGGVYVATIYWSVGAD